MNLLQGGKLFIGLAIFQEGDMATDGNASYFRKANTEMTVLHTVGVGVVIVAILLDGDEEIFGVSNLSAC